MSKDVTKRTIKVMTEYPATRKNDWNLLHAYYTIYHNADSFLLVGNDRSAPPPESILRAKRRANKIIKEVKE